MDDLYARLPRVKTPDEGVRGAPLSARFWLWALSAGASIPIWLVFGPGAHPPTHPNTFPQSSVAWLSFIAIVALVFSVLYYFQLWARAVLTRQVWSREPSFATRWLAWGSLVWVIGAYAFNADHLRPASYGNALAFEFGIAALGFTLASTAQKKKGAPASAIAIGIAIVVAFIVWPHVLLSIVAAHAFPGFAAAFALVGAAATLNPRHVHADDTAARETYPHLAVGQATGEFARRHAGRAPRAGYILTLDIANATRGTIVVGPQGSGKTSGVFTPALEQALRQGWSALVFAVKSDVPQRVRDLAAKYGRVAHIIAPGEGFERLNLLHGLSPEAAAAAIGDRIGDPKDPYWKHAPVSLVQSWLQILYGVNGEAVDVPSMESKGDRLAMVSHRVSLAYSLDSLRDVIYLDGDELRDVLEVANQVARTLADSSEPSDRERLNHLTEALRYFTGEYYKTFVKPRNGSEQLSGIRASLLPHLRALTGDRAIRTTFAGETDVDLAYALANGEVVCVYVDDSQYPMAFANVMTFIFRRFADIAQSRLSTNVTPCLLSADEYGSFASPDHVAPLSRARQAKFIPLMGFQSLSQLGAAMGNKKDAAHGIVGAFASLIACGAADPQTADYVRDRVGQTTIREEMQSHTTEPGNGLFFNSPTLKSTNTSTNIRQEWLVDGHTLASLGPHGGYVRAIAVVAQQGGELRDVVNLPQL